MSSFSVPRPRRLELAADVLMTPVMFILRGCKADSLQETHPWHIEHVDPARVDVSLAVRNHGRDNSRFGFDKKALFLFHAPIFGGWKDFSVYEVSETDTPFHIGWMFFKSSDSTLLEAAVHKLPVADRQIRMLDGSRSSWAYFFALNSEGVQVPLKKVGSGRIGDKTYAHIRLF